MNTDGPMEIVTMATIMRINHMVLEFIVLFMVIIMLGNLQMGYFKVLYTCAISTCEEQHIAMIYYIITPSYTGTV